MPYIIMQKGKGKAIAVSDIHHDRSFEIRKVGSQWVAEPGRHMPVQTGEGRGRTISAALDAALTQFNAGLRAARESGELPPAKPLYPYIGAHRETDYPRRKKVRSG